MKESEDYYIDERGYRVMTESFLKKRGWCCGCGCRHCPYDYENLPSPWKEIKKAERAQREKSSGIPSSQTNESE